MDVVSPIMEIPGASSVINRLIEAVATYVRDQYYWKTDLQEQLQRLQRLFSQIQTVVDFAERKLIWHEASNPALMKWLRQFKDEIDEAEEVLDELEYLKLEKKFNRGKSRFSRAVDASLRVSKRFLKLDDVPERLKTCVNNLNNSASYVQNFLTLVSQTDTIGTGQMQQEILPLTNESRITSSLPGLSFKGREKEKGKIIQYLLAESAGESEIQRSENVHCLTLVAMGGMGKTALAQQVFDHFENVKKEHFHIKIWVCVSTDFNASSLMKKILEYSTDRSESGPLERLPVKLKEELHSKNFLLVLDDVWDDDNETEWEKLCAPLLYGPKGSWILLTTRMESVANMVSKVIKGTMAPMTLPGLSEDECRSLLYEHAFAGQDPNGFRQLKEIGEEIVEKLNGIPLLAKSIGGALSSKLEVDHWTSISRNEVWRMPYNSKSKFIPALTLSYVMLPPRLKRCFSYCGIFPEDYKFNKQKLVCMWVAAGLIYREGLEEGSDEDIANCCFDMLCNKSFFDFHTYNRRPLIWERPFYAIKGEIYYTMHDMLNGLVCHVSRYECCRIVHGAPSNSILDYNTIRHLFISLPSTDAQLHDIVKVVCKLKHLRTLWIHYNGFIKKYDDFIRDACKSPRRIRVLILQFNHSRFAYECLESFSDFVKLRFLHISADWIKDTIPPKIKSKLYFLQVLMGNGFYPTLAKDANKLTNLRHLYDMPEDAVLSVADIGKLTSLQQLCFYVGTGPGHRIDELMNLNDLHQLKIKRLSNVRSLEEAHKVNLVRKENLTRLELQYRDGEDDCNEENSNPDLDQLELLAALQPHTKIRELSISHYEGVTLAPWMDTSSLSRLESLQLCGCTSLEELPPLWKLPCLKFLKLKQMKALRSLGCHFSGQIDEHFPVLEKCVFRDLPLLEEWNGADGHIWFPHLKSFEIKDCPKLKKIPYLPLSMENLRLQNLGLEAVPRSYRYSNGSRTFGGLQQLMSLESLEVYDCSMIVQIGSIGQEDDNLLPSSLKTLGLGVLDKHEDLASYLRGFTSLDDLSLSCSPGMESLPLAGELEHLTALRRLRISDGEELISPGGLYIIKSLKSLKICDCPKFLSAEVESREFLEEKIRKNAVSSSSVFDHSESNKAASILPSSLEFLCISNSDISQEALGRCLQGLTSLKNLEISGCRNLVSLPNIEYLRNLTALRTLNISYCEELRELESLTALVSLREMKINGCPKLLATTTTEQSATKKKKGTLPLLEKINIDNIFYLPILPNAERLDTLFMENQTENLPVFTCFPSEIEEWLMQCQESLEYLLLCQMPRLQYLPARLERFSSLRYFGIFFTPELKSLPRMPASLERLWIYDCSAKLKKRCQENIGPDWPNINHIPYIHITSYEKDKTVVRKC